eukprot:7817329-Pyramimonas_sp.AAC.1
MVGKYNTNSSADLARVADRIQTSGYFRRTRLTTLDRLGVPTSFVAILQLELSTEKPTAPVKMTRNSRSRLSAFWQ